MQLVSSQQLYVKNIFSISLRLIFQKSKTDFSFKIKENSPLMVLEL
jgi:hypothetical protein